MIIAKAPTRISLFGGGTDCNPYNSKFGGKVINFAINLRHKVELSPRDDKWVWVEAMGESRIWKLDGKFEYGIDPKFDLIRSIINAYDLETGFNFKDTFEGIQGAGLGSSGSAAVAMIGAMDYWQNMYSDNKHEIAERAWNHEAYDLGWFSGWQDQKAAAHGGFNLFESTFNIITTYPLRRAIIDSFLPWLSLFFTGKTRKSSDIQQAFYEEMKDKLNKGEPLKALSRIRELVDEALPKLESFEFMEVGKLLNKSWQAKKNSSPLASNKLLDEIYLKGLERGAIGGKVLGAGGEGHILFVTKPEARSDFIKEMEERGIKHIDFSIDWNGLEVRKV